MGKPRLMHLFNAFEVGGVERQHMMLVRELAPYYEQACWSYNEGPIQNELDMLGITHRAGRFPVAAAMIEQGRFDCVVLRTNRYLREMAGYFSGCETPVVYVRSFLRWFEGNKTYFDAELERISYEMADYALFSGPSLQKAARTLSMEIPGDELLFNGLELARFPMRPREFSGQGPLRVGMLANLAPHKNQLIAINALEPLLRDGRCEFVLGGAAHFPDYAAKVAEAAAGLPVELKGYVPDPVAFNADVDAMLLASTHEGWPIALMEAMACGIPVMAPDLGDTACVLDHGRAGMIYPAGEYGRIATLVEALRDPETYAAFARAGVEHVRGFDIRNTAAKLRNAIETARRNGKRA